MEDLLAFSIILVKEIELLEGIPPLQKHIRDAVINKKWADYDQFMQSLSEIGVQFEIMELEREAMFKSFQSVNNNESFYAWAVRLPKKEQEEISGLYRKLKMITLNIKISNDTLMEYLREAKSMVSGFLGTVYPDRRGKMYTSKGVELEADMRSVMINQNF